MKRKELLEVRPQLAGTVIRWDNRGMSQNQDQVRVSE